jgi:MraZ protein
VLEEGDPDWTDGLRPELVLVYGTSAQNYIEGYTVIAMDAIEDAIEELPYGDDREEMEMNYSTKSLSVNIDDTGRIILPPMLVEKLGLDGEAVFAGTGKTFRIWHPDTYADYVAAREAAMAARGDGYDLRRVLNKPAGG